MALAESDNLIYQQILKQVPEVSLNLMAIKVENRPEDFLGWCKELSNLMATKLNYELLEPEQLPTIKKIQVLLEKAISVNQLKLLRITPWPLYVEFIKQNEANTALSERFALLDYLRQTQTTPLQEQSELDRLAFAGKHTAAHDPAIYQFDIEWFASTKGARHFHQIFAERPAEFAQALDLIPSDGKVLKADFDAFVKAYKVIFEVDLDGQPSSETAPLMPATRLLMAKRPDQFVALNNQKAELLCQALGVAKLTSGDFEGYWSEIIERVQSAQWWSSAEPESEDEQRIWNNRAALIDVFYYADENTPLQSNYLKAKDRKSRPAAPNKAATGRKRSKETAEQIVDRRLEDPELPAYLKDKRDSLVHEVEKGKTVDQAIQLFRAIFG